MSTARRDRPAAGTYAIRVQGRLDPRWAVRFDGCALTHGDDGTTVLTCRAVDQAALHGALQVLRDLGLPLLSVTPVEPGPAPAPAAAEATAPSSPRSAR